jgi:hypothetical protein
MPGPIRQCQSRRVPETRPRLRAALARSAGCPPPLCGLFLCGTAHIVADAPLVLVFQDKLRRSLLERPSGPDTIDLSLTRLLPAIEIASSCFCWETRMAEASSEARVMTQAQISHHFTGDDTATKHARWGWRMPRIVGRSTPLARPPMVPLVRREPRRYVCSGSPPSSGDANAGARFSPRSPSTSLPVL